MIYKNVEFHNIAEARTVEGHDGLHLQRIPESIRTHLEKPDAIRNPGSAEIRFVCDGPARVTLSSLETCKASVFYGVFQTNEVIQFGQEPVIIELDPTDRIRRLFGQRGEMPFAPQVRRIMLRGKIALFEGIEGEGIRPPHPNELPRLRYLSYGTSITHGAAATSPHLPYVAQTARRLGVDLLNLGMGGSAHCEPALADYIAARNDWDFATLAMSVNMIGAGFTPEAFEHRVRYMVNTVARANTRRPVACITIYPFYGDLLGPEPHHAAEPEEYRRRLRTVVAECPYPNVHLIEGPHLLTSYEGLTPDLIHPADNGMIQMGENLAAALRPLIAGL
jgi:lysophospholipase L1-like esterase